MELLGGDRCHGVPGSETQRHALRRIFADAVVRAVGYERYRVLVSVGEAGSFHVVLSAQGGRWDQAAGRCRQQHVCQAAQSGIGRWWPGVYRWGLYAVLPDDAGGWDARWGADS